MRMWCAFDANKNVVSAQGSNTGGATIVVPASGVKYYRLSIFSTDINTFQFEQSSTATSYTAYGFTLNSAVLANSSTANYDYTHWAGVLTGSFGDSITAQQAWQPAVASALGLVHTAYGVGGRQVSGASGMCQDAAINAMPTNLGLILVLGGTNDWAQSVALGATTSSNTSEFYGAYNQMCQKLTTRFPNARIVLLTTTYGELPGRVTDLSWSTAYANTLGLTTRDYAEAVRVMGKRWGMPVAETDMAGWNTINIANFITNDGGLLHPNATGGARMAEVVIGKLRKLTPSA